MKMNDLPIIQLRGSFILKADIEGQVSCSVSAKDGLSIKDAFWEKLELTGGRKWENFLVYTKWTRIHIEWEMNVSCVRGHALLIVNKLDNLPTPLPGAHHFMRKDVIHTAAAPYSEKDFYYMIRPSGSAKNIGSFALVITTPSAPNGRSCLRHVTIAFDRETSKFLLCSTEFDSLDSLVVFFKTTPIKAHNGPNMYLRYPVPVDPQLDEDCKKPWRTTRTGKRLDHPDCDTISLWSCSSSLTVNSINTPLSYDYDGSVSGLSEDDQPYDFPRRQMFRKDKARGSSLLNRDETAMSPMSDSSHGHIYSSDVEMRATSGSSSGASASSGGSFSSSSKSKVSFNNTPRGTRRSQFFLPQSRDLELVDRQRPLSEVHRKQSADSCNDCNDPFRTSSMPPTMNFQPVCRSSDSESHSTQSPEETYVLMTPSTDTTTTRPLTPQPLTVETMKRHPVFQICSGSDPDSADSRTLTRLDEPASGYMNVTLNNTSSQEEDPLETYVEMNQLRPPPPHLLLGLKSDNHEYINRPRSPYSSPASLQGSEYQNLSNFDPVTTQKLIENVQSLMSTVKEQAKEILTLKMTVKELKLKVEAIEQMNTEEFEYAE